MRAGALEHSNEGFNRQQSGCQRVVLPAPPNEHTRAESHALRWMAPECCAVNPPEFVQIFATAATGKHAHFVQADAHLISDTSTCNCTGAAWAPCSGHLPLQGCVE